jgi:predicted enzyme related to lactoylglutathione lyase
MTLSNSKIAANVPVNDMPRAIKFYSETLGLKVMPMTPWAALVMAESGMIALSLRAKPMQTDNDICNFTVDDINATMKELQGKGVEFMDYDLPWMKTVNHIGERDGFQAAWFKDSEGNLLQINQAPKR